MIMRKLTCNFGGKNDVQDVNIDKAFVVDSE